MMQKGLLKKATALGALVLLLDACSTVSPPPAPTPPPEKLHLSSVSFDDMPGWSQDRTLDALPALQKSCGVLLHKPATAAMGFAGKVKDWQSACTALKQNPPQSEDAMRSFLARNFKPYKASSPAGSLFTGYYEAELRGSWQRSGPYQTPLWQKPVDLLSADLGDFKPELKGKKIVGKVQGQSFTPYDDRAAIARQSLNGRAQPLLWVDDKISAFFLEIQGSGRVKLPDGSMIRVGYDAQNGHPFVPIARPLLQEGLVDKPVTMRKIRAWLESHPDRAETIMDKNPSVVFFKRTEADGAVGAQGVVLTPMRSMAVDPSFIPLGTPLFVAMDNKSGGDPRLVVAQDTGGAIKGAVRGDMFCGTGTDAEEHAGGLQSTGTYYLLLPRNLAVSED